MLNLAGPGMRRSVMVPSRRRVIDRLRQIDRLFDHNWRWRGLQCAVPGFLGLSGFLLAALFFQFAGLHVHSFCPLLSLPDFFQGGVRRHPNFHSLNTRWWRKRGIGHISRTIDPFVERGCISGLPGEPDKYQKNGIG